MVPFLNALAPIIGSFLQRISERVELSAQVRNALTMTLFPNLTEMITQLNKRNHQGAEADDL
jgi:hypothetical protein